MPRFFSRHKFLYETFLYFIRLKSEDLKKSGAGEVYFDTDSVSWSNVGDTRELTVEVKKGGYPFLCFAFDETAEKSIINNNKVLIGKTESGGFNALFMYKNIGFFVSADGLSQDEFVSVISSLLK